MNTIIKRISSVRKNKIVILLTIFFIYSIGLSLFSLPGIPDGISGSNLFPYLADKPVSEDAFYMLTIAWNLGQGEGFVYNYDQPSTGVQPLATIVYGIIAFFIQLFDLDKFELIRAVLIFNILLIPLFFLNLKKISILIFNVQSDSATFFLLMICFFNNEIFRTFTFGLETGIYLVLFSGVVLYSIKYFKGNQNNLKTFQLGVLIGLTILARIDFLIVICSFTLFLLYFKRIKLTKLLSLVLISTVIIFPWIEYVYRITGSIIPSSGGAQAKVITFNETFSRLQDLIIAGLTHFSPWLYSGGYLLVSIIGFCTFLLIYMYKKKLNLKIIPKNNPDAKIFFYWIFSFVPLVMIYFIFFWASHFYIRYTTPLLIFIIPVTAQIIFRKFEGSILSNFFTIVMVLLFIFQSIYAFHLGRISNNHLISAGKIKNSFDSSVKIGAFQSGIVGYLNENVINLDGKTNFDALKQIKKDSIESYILSEKIKVIVDWQSAIDKYIDRKYLENNWVVYDTVQNRIGENVSIIWRSKDFIK